MMKSFLICLFFHLCVSICCAFLSQVNIPAFKSNAGSRVTQKEHIRDIPEPSIVQNYASNQQHKLGSNQRCKISMVSQEHVTDENFHMNKYDDTCAIWNKLGSNDTISSLLVCGDGDLSFSSAIAPILNERGIQLVATVLEEEEAHQSVYQDSRMNKDTISSFHNHIVQFGVDVTYLEELFPNQTFDRIQFNFPHWRGKANHKYNRQLIDAFLKSASRIVSPSGGEIHMALVQGQGGSNAKSMSEYRDTWTPNSYAANHGLLLSKVEPFRQARAYNLSSHRGVDRGFKIGAEPKMFIFSKSNGPDSIIPKRNLLCCRHELHILLPNNEINHDMQNSEANAADSSYSVGEIVDGDAVQRIIQNIVPNGIRVEIPSRTLLEKKDTGYETDMLVFTIVYCGEYKAMRRDEADGYRSLAEEEIEKFILLRENRKGRLVSKPFPYFLLDSIL